MDRFAGLVLKASQALGAPLHLAAHLGVEPYDVYRWIAGMDLPEPIHRESFEQRLLNIVEAKLGRNRQIVQGPQRRFSDRQVGF